MSFPCLWGQSTPCSGNECMCRQGLVFFEVMWLGWKQKAGSCFRFWATGCYNLRWNIRLVGSIWLYLYMISSPLNWGDGMFEILRCFQVEEVEERGAVTHDMTFFPFSRRHSFVFFWFVLFCLFVCLLKQGLGYCGFWVLVLQGVVLRNTAWARSMFLFPNPCHFWVRHGSKPSVGGRMVTPLCVVDGYYSEVVSYRLTPMPLCRK